MYVTEEEEAAGLKGAGFIPWKDTLTLSCMDLLQVCITLNSFHTPDYVPAEAFNVSAKDLYNRKEKKKVHVSFLYKHIFLNVKSFK